MDKQDRDFLCITGFVLVIIMLPIFLLPAGV
jgi:hypothetical protein